MRRLSIVQKALGAWLAVIAGATDALCQTGETALIGENPTYHVVEYDTDPEQCIVMRSGKPMRCTAGELQDESAANLAHLARMVSTDRMVPGPLKDWLEEVPDGAPDETGREVFFIQGAAVITIVNYRQESDGLVMLDGDIVLGEPKGLQQFNADLIAAVASRLSTRHMNDKTLKLWIAKGIQTPPPDAARAALGDGVRKWNKNCIPILLEPSLQGAERHKLIAAAGIWNNSGVNLKVVLSEDPATECPNNPIVEPVWMSGNICQASLGPGALIPTESNDYREWIRPLLRLSGSCSAGSIAHEFFHLAGFMHEHQRTFLGKYLTKTTDGDINLTEFKTVKITDYDPCSISHYPVDHGFVLTPEGERRAASCAKQFPGNVQVPGQRVGLSILDVWAINELY